MSRLIINRKDSVEFLPVAEILFFQRKSRRTTVQLISGSVQVRDPLSKLEKAVPYLQFIRVNRSLLVNREHIIRADKQQKTLTLSNGAIIPYSLTDGALLQSITKIQLI